MIIAALTIQILFGVTVYDDNHHRPYSRQRAFEQCESVKVVKAHSKEKLAKKADKAGGNAVEVIKHERIQWFDHYGRVMKTRYDFKGEVFKCPPKILGKFLAKN